MDKRWLMVNRKIRSKSHAMTWTMYIYDNTYVHGYEGAERTEFKGGGQSQPANSIYPQNFVTVTPVTRSHAQFVIVINLSKLF